MNPGLTIGDFSKATHLSVNTLRHYHHIGLLEPKGVDPETGYRRYATEQIPAAQVIRRFRALDMPLDEIQAVLSAPDLRARDTLIAAHLARMEARLARTHQAVASLRDLLEHRAAPPPVGHRRAEETPARAISEEVGVADALLWYQGALGELRATLAAQGVRADGHPGGIPNGPWFFLGLQHPRALYRHPTPTTKICKPLLVRLPNANTSPASRECRSPARANAQRMGVKCRTLVNVGSPLGGESRGKSLLTLSPGDSGSWS